MPIVAPSTLVGNDKTSRILHPSLSITEKNVFDDPGSATRFSSTFQDIFSGHVVNSNNDAVVGLGYQQSKSNPLLPPYQIFISRKNTTPSPVGDILVYDVGDEAAVNDLLNAVMQISTEFAIPDIGKPIQDPANKQGLKTNRPKGFPIAIVKMTTKPTLREVFAIGSKYDPTVWINLTDPKDVNKRFWKSIADFIYKDGEIKNDAPGLIPDSWTGIIVFGLGIAIDTKSAFAKIQIPDTLHLPLLALAGRTASDIEVSAARLDWSSKAKRPKVPAEKSIYALESVQATMIDGRLTQFTASANLQIGELFFNTKIPSSKNAVKLKGQIDPNSNSLEMAASDANSLIQISGGTEAVIKECKITGFKLNASLGNNTQTEEFVINVSGSITIGTITVAPHSYLHFLDGKRYEFKDVRLFKSNQTIKGGPELQANYAAVKLKAVGIPVNTENALPLSLKHQKTIWVNDETLEDKFSEESYLPVIYENNHWQTKVWGFLLEFSFKWLPPASWFATAKSIELKFVIGATTADRSHPAPKPVIALAPSGVDGFRIKLGSVLDFGVERFVMDSYPAGVGTAQKKLPYFTATDGKLALFGHQLVDNLNVLIHGVNNSDQSSWGGFFSTMKGSSKSAQKGAFKINWLIAGGNTFSQSWGDGDGGLLEQFGKIDAKWEDNEGKLKGLVGDFVSDPIKNYFPVPDPTTPTISKWLFAASIEIANTKAILVFVDAVGGGMRLTGALMKLLKIDQLVLLYFSETPQRAAYFSLEFSLIPKTGLDLGFAVISGGIFRVEWAPNGSRFLADLGYPAKSENGPRRWDRAVTLWFGLIQMSGGVYFESHKHLDTPSPVPTPPPPGSGPLPAQPVHSYTFGIAGQWGYGVALSKTFGPAKLFATARVGLYVVVEGNIDFYEETQSLPAKSEFVFSAVAGVLVEVRISLQVWCLSIEAWVIATAEVGFKYSPIQLKNRTDSAKLTALSLCRYRSIATDECLQKQLAFFASSKVPSQKAKTPIPIVFEFGFIIGAEIRINLGLFSITKSISVPIKQTVQLNLEI
jgi:hypothetical protein